MNKGDVDLTFKFMNKGNVDLTFKFMNKGDVDLSFKFMNKGDVDLAFKAGCPSLLNHLCCDAGRCPGQLEVTEQGRRGGGACTAEATRWRADCH